MDQSQYNQYERERGTLAGATSAGMAYQQPQSMPSDESPSPIRDGVSTAESLLSDIHGAIAMLEKRLDTVLTPAPPQPGNATGGPSKMQTPSHLHGRLVILNEGFGYAVQRLRELRQRVEV